jgi:hypothetical protein
MVFGKEKGWLPKKAVLKTGNSCKSQLYEKLNFLHPGCPNWGLTDT